MQVFVEVDGVLSSNHLLFPTLALLHHCHLPPVKVQPKNHPSNSITHDFNAIDNQQGFQLNFCGKEEWERKRERERDLWIWKSFDPQRQQAEAEEREERDEGWNTKTLNKPNGPHFFVFGSALEVCARAQLNEKIYTRPKKLRTDFQGQNQYEQTFVEQQKITDFLYQKRNELTKERFSLPKKKWTDFASDQKKRF